MNKQRRKQQEFLSSTFGGPIPWTGKDLRKAHENIDGPGKSTSTPWPGTCRNHWGN